MSGTTVVSGQPFTALFDPYRRVDTNWKIVGAADMDQDGWVDLVGSMPPMAGSRSPPR